MAREVVTFRHFLQKLEPRFDDCPSPCALSEAEEDRPDFCKECEVAKQFEFFQESFEAQIERRFNGESLQWSFQSLYADVGRVMKIDRALEGKGYPKGCSALTAKLLDILRVEEFRPKRIEIYELEQKLKRKEHG